MAAGWIGGHDGLVRLDGTVRVGLVLVPELAGRDAVRSEFGQSPAPLAAEAERAEAVPILQQALGQHIVGLAHTDDLRQPATPADNPQPPAAIAAAIRAGHGGGQPNTLADFVRGYRDAGGRPAWEERFVSVVIPCESGWRLDLPGFYLGLAQWHPDTWEQAGGGDYRDPWQQGHNVAVWSNTVDPASAGGWQECWSG